MPTLQYSSYQEAFSQIINDMLRDYPNDWEAMLLSYLDKSSNPSVKRFGATLSTAIATSTTHFKDQRQQAEQQQQADEDQAFSGMAEAIARRQSSRASNYTRICT